jgi:nitrate reductase NapAB chaperone NapD
MSILGVVLRAHPQQRSCIAARLGGLPGVEIAADPGDGRWVLVLEDQPGAPLSAAALLGQMATWPEVLGTSLVYEYSGPESPAPGDGPADYRAWRESLPRS